jgi:hypothetical protein
MQIDPQFINTQLAQRFLLVQGNLANKFWPVLLFHDPHGMLQMFQRLGFFSLECKRSG